LDPSRSQFDVPAVSDEELGPKLTLKSTDLIGERGTGNVKLLCCPTEVQFLGHGYEVSELPELHAIDVSGAIPAVALALRSSRELSHFGNMSWTLDDEEGLLHQMISSEQKDGEGRSVDSTSVSAHSAGSI
jgi:hypothetical protein